MYFQRMFHYSWLPCERLYIMALKSYFNSNFIQVVNGQDIVVSIAVAADQIKVII